jgi:hypothetical protein
LGRKAEVLASQSDVSFGSHDRHLFDRSARGKGASATEPSNSEAARHVGGAHPQICPATGKSVICLSSPLCKNILLRVYPKSNLELSPSRPLAGALAIVTNVGMGCGGRGSVGRCQGMAGRVDTARDLTNGTQTDGAFRVRQSRVVLAPVAGVKSAEASRPDRV